MWSVKRFQTSGFNALLLRMFVSTFPIKILAEATVICASEDFFFPLDRRQFSCRISLSARSNSGVGMRISVF